MSKKRLERVSFKEPKNAGRIYDLYKDKIVLLARTEFVEARAKDGEDHTEIEEFIMSGGPHLKVGDTMIFGEDTKVKFTNFKLDQEHDLAQYFDLTVIEISYENINKSPLVKLKDKILSKLGFE
jgi:phosphoribosyl-dephospho-CoA transferase